MKRAVFAGIAVMLGAALSGCDPNIPEDKTQDKTVMGLTILRLPYRVTYDGKPDAPSFERDGMLAYLGGDTGKLPAHKGYREGEFIENRDLTALPTEEEPEKGNRLILHGFKARVHYQDGSSQDIEFPQNWQAMGNLGKDGAGVQFAWSPGKAWSFLTNEYITVTLDKASAAFDIPYYKLQAVLIDKEKTDDELRPALTVNGTVSMYEYESETGTKGIRPKIGVIGYYERIGWQEVPEKVRIEAPLTEGAVRLKVHRGYTPIYPIDPLVYTIDPNVQTVDEPWPSRYIQSGIPVPENPVAIDPAPSPFFNTVPPYYSVSSGITFDINPSASRYVDTYTIE
ncbi:MAG: hypothetical protein LBD13_06875 [Spirochaetaceae bacterium]|jgi:hypothetical protein|nr:hypothetical protein [Spirochaetaceae bacterium]